MFSSTTIASSTTSPIASTSASSTSVLMVKPASAMRMNAPTRLTGMVTSGMIDARKVRRNTNTTSATSTTDSMTVVYTALIERSMNTDRSLASTTVTLAGRSRWIAGIAARTPSATSSGLAVALRITPVLIDGTPFRRTRERSLAAASCTCATSRRRTVVVLLLPVEMVRSAMSLNCATVFRSVRAVTLNSRCWLSMRPAGTSRFCLRKASSTSCTVSR